MFTGQPTSSSSSEFMCLCDSVTRVFPSLSADSCSWIDVFTQGRKSVRRVWFPLPLALFRNYSPQCFGMKSSPAYSLLPPVQGFIFISDLLGENKGWWRGGCTFIPPFVWKKSFRGFGQQDWPCADILLFSAPFEPSGLQGLVLP